MVTPPTPGRAAGAWSHHRGRQAGALLSSVRRRDTSRDTQTHTRARARAHARLSSPPASTPNASSRRPLVAHSVAIGPAARRSSSEKHTYHRSRRHETKTTVVARSRLATRECPPLPHSSLLRDDTMLLRDARECHRWNLEMENARAAFLLSRQKKTKSRSRKRRRTRLTWFVTSGTPEASATRACASSKFVTPIRSIAGCSASSRSWRRRSAQRAGPPQPTTVAAVVTDGRGG